MLSLALFNIVTLAAALLIGVASARWAFAKRRPAPDRKPEEPPAP